MPNRVGDQNHPKFVKEVKTVEEIDKKSKTPENAGGDGVSTENAGGTSIGTKQDLTGDPNIDAAKKSS